MAFSWKVCLPLPWWPLPMSSRQDCKWLPALARRHTVASSTVSGRYSGKKGPQHFGKGLQVGSGLMERLAWGAYPPLLFASHPGVKCLHLLSLFFSSSVSILSPVWCYLGHLWTSPAVVLHWFWRPVSAALKRLCKEKLPNQNTFVFSLQRHFWDSEKLTGQRIL